MWTFGALVFSAMNSYTGCLHLKQRNTQTHIEGKLSLQMETSKSCSLYDECETEKIEERKCSIGFLFS